MKVSELTGALLDYWVARAEEFPVYECGTESWPGNGAAHAEGFLRPIITVGLRGVAAGVFIEHMGEARPYAPSTDWQRGGRLIDKYRFTLAAAPKGQWAIPHVGFALYGDTPLQAICRAVVRAKFGDEVPDAIR